MFFFFVKQQTAYEMRISDWSSDVCSSDLEKSASSNPPTRMVDINPTSLSPCSPSTSASTLPGATSSSPANNVRRRLESSNVPVPMIRLAGRPAQSNAIMAIRSTGLDATSMMPLKPAAESSVTQDRKSTSLNSSH